MRRRRVRRGLGYTKPDHAKRVPKEGHVAMVAFRKALVVAKSGHCSFAVDYLASGVFAQGVTIGHLEAASPKITPADDQIIRQSMDRARSAVVVAIRQRCLRW